MGIPICVLNRVRNEQKAFDGGKERCVRKTQEGFSAQFQSNGFSHEKPAPQERSSCGYAYGNTVCVLNRVRNEQKAFVDGKERAKKTPEGGRDHAGTGIAAPTAADRRMGA